MYDSRQTTPTISVPFIYLKLKSVKDSVPRKIIYPSSYDQLLNTALRIFKDFITVRSFFNEDGIQVENMNDVPPGSVLLCSELAPYTDPHNEQDPVQMVTPKKRTFDVMSKTSFTRIFGTEFGDSPAQVVFNPVDTTKGKPVDISDRVPKGINLSPRKNDIPATVAAAKQAKKRESRLVALRKRLSSTPQSKLPEPIKEKTPSPKKSGKFGNFLETGNLSEEFNTPKSDTIQLKSSAKKAELENSIKEAIDPMYVKKAKTEEEVEEVKNSNIYNVFTQLLNDDFLGEDGKEALMYFDKPTRSLIAHLPELEDIQKARWFSKSFDVIHSYGFPIVDESLIGYDSMIGIARCNIMDHRFNTKNGSLHRFNVAITGPRRSGKSTFLSIFIQELLLEMATTEKWKEYFIFALDMEHISEICNDFELFYTYMVEATFKQIEHQCPQNAQYIPMIQKYFLSVLLYENPPQFSKPFRESEQTRVLANELQQIANQLSAAWNDVTAFNQFITNCMMFPKMICDIFGLKHMLFIFDNFEVSDIFICPQAPFSEESDNFEFMSLLVYMITINDFIICCKDPHKLADLHLNVEYLSTLNISTDNAYTNSQFNASINNEIIPLTVEHCGGIPSYVYSWILLNEFYDYTRKIQSRREREEAEITLIEKVENLMKLLFMHEDGEDELTVDSVSRTNVYK
ncbi:hypothetical protein TRFO_06169 [Tritrichomonas foetus]|uniref:Doublecortin domain-containing protein n=1 Tax=Tritrichomonas foetus TaxID=1144522 RepID=A0A1J4K1A3_9EUKA|nr:hypothetical protein TRFO_06169 [Tritrichomonas foetus]|eukprot:OHT04738.1 hypothetical protein TRFO_06169 [Tritrichomonas foetus]